MNVLGINLVCFSILLLRSQYTWNICHLKINVDMFVVRSHDVQQPNARNLYPTIDVSEKCTDENNCYPGSCYIGNCRCSSGFEGTNCNHGRTLLISSSTYRNSSYR